MATKQSMIQAKYDAKNSKVYSLKFNRKTDAEIIEKLDQVESRNGYIKQLIREDLARTRPGSVPVSVPDSVPDIDSAPDSAPELINDGGQKNED